MEDFSKMTDKIRLPLDIAVAPYLMDHMFEGKAVLPAVEAMRILAESTLEHLPGMDIDCILDAKFDKFLFVDSNEKHITAFNEIEIDENDLVLSKLITKTRHKKSGIIRVKEHVCVGFRPCEMQFTEPDITGSEESFSITPDRLYKELVPFGPSYRNIKEISLFKRGAVATIQDFLDIGFCPLGSPFPLDAAFHAACAWGQRYTGVVAFPVGFDSRRIVRPTKTGEKYMARIKTAGTDSGLLIFDIWIHTADNETCEEVSGVRMRDISAGRMKPPEWIIKQEQS